MKVQYILIEFSRILSNLTGYLFHLFDFEYRYTNGKLVYINTTAHKLITMGNHFCTSRIKEKKNSYMFQTKYLN